MDGNALEGNPGRAAVLFRPLEPRAARGVPKLRRRGGYTPVVAHRGGQVVVVSPILFRQHSTARPLMRSRNPRHPASSGLLQGRRPFQHLRGEPPRHLRILVPPWLCRFCSVAQALTRRACARPPGSQSGDFPQLLPIAGEGPSAAHHVLAAPGGPPGLLPVTVEVGVPRADGRKLHGRPPGPRREWMRPPSPRPNPGPPCPRRPG